ncbi:MAG: FtsQ-type POTRA domain-containing protein [Spirochaetaceae bacterium]|jgi:cell division protein FtsQ|nr:FtsQ-type POTRA domain-containing protein [Spirochaetaceae bacterium]
MKNPVLERKILLLSILLVCLIILIEIILSQLILPRLVIREIRLDSDLSISDETLFQLCGMDESNNYLNIRQELLEQKFLSIPQVKTASVYKRFPSTLVIKIERRRAIALLWKQDLSGQGLLAVDSTGIIFPHDRGSEQWDLPVINGVDLTIATPGDKLDETYEFLLQDLQTLKDNYLAYYSIISEIRVIPQEGDTIGLRMILTTYPTAARCTLPLNKNLIEKAILVLDVLKEQGMSDEIDEVDLQRDSLRYRKMEA